MAADQEQKKTERLHMLISPNELEAIDEWRFKNRIGTRADAVRRLVQLGLRSDSVAMVLEVEAGNVLRHILAIAEDVQKLQVDDDAKASLDRWLRVVIEKEADMLERLTLLSAQAQAFRSSSDVTEAMAEAERKTWDMVDLLRSKGHLSDEYLAEKKKI